MKYALRLPALDALRFVGALLVIGLHVGQFDAWPKLAGDAVSTCLRWVVPYFLFLSGFFIARANDPTAAALTSLRRVFAITLAAQVIFLPIVVTDVGIKGLGFKLLNADALLRGIWFHFWYLHAAILGLLIAVSRPTWIASGKVQAAAAVVFLGMSAVDTRFAIGKGDFEMMAVSRTFAGVAMLWIGFGLARISSKLQPVVIGVLGVVSVALAITHACFVISAGGDASKLQMNIGAVCAAAVLLLTCTRWAPAKLDSLAALGRTYGLGLYLFHPAVVFLLQRAGVQRAETLWACAAVLTLGALAAAQRFAPRLKAATDGHW